MKNIIKPTEKRHVYDLLKETGMDVSDWSNYARPQSPAANPKYCYNWAFVQDDLVVLCLWFEDMKEDECGIYQQLNYREINASARESIVRKRRAGEMDRAFQAAKNRNFPIRVILVDGPPREERKEDESPVQKRGLDSEPWHIEFYDDDGNCIIRRGLKASARVIAESDRRLARIAYNSAGWRAPTGEAGEYETSNTYNAKNMFGHEDWLFRSEWILDGWRYAFIEGFNTKNQTYSGKVLDVSLYTVLPNKKCRLVGTISQVEGLTEDLAKAAVDTFKSLGWFDTMKAEIEAIGGNAASLDETEYAPHILNVRFKVENIDLYEKEIYFEDNQWIKDRHRYMLYKFEEKEREDVEKTAIRRRGTYEAPEVKKLFRKGIKPVQFTPEHQMIQRKLVEELREKYPVESIICEEDYVDVRVETASEVTFYEIKTDLNPRTVIRQAVGQLLEYAYHPLRSANEPDNLVIVGRAPLKGKDAEYLNQLINKFNLPLSYKQIEL